MVVLTCTVRDCRRPLEREGKSLRCEQGHSFDIARSGYVNLLQAHDRRSPHPGDPPEAQAARARYLDRGFEAPLVETLREILAAERSRLPDRPLALLDVGCGGGFFLREMCRHQSVDAHGLDISTAGIDAAARLQPDATFVVANADRALPHADASYDVVTSINARLNAPEFRRVLRVGGLLVVVVPAPDDLIELRAAVLGEGAQRDRMPRVAAELAAGFTPDGIGTRTVRHVAPMDPAALRDALALTYRGARQSRQENIDALDTMNVTIAHDVGCWRRVG